MHIHCLLSVRGVAAYHLSIAGDLDDSKPDYTGFSSMQVINIVPITFHCIKGVSILTSNHILRLLREQRRC